MSDLNCHVQDYLAMRRGLGFKLTFAGQVLPDSAAYLDTVGASTITVESAVAWAGLPQGVQPISLSHRLGAVRGFARYLQSIDPATEVPPCGIWPSVAPRPVPYLWSDTEICSLLAAARELHPPLRAATYETLFGLLASSGMRIGEALNLGRDDINLSCGDITVHRAKFDRPRLVPVHPSTAAALRVYATGRDEQWAAHLRSSAFFSTSTGTALGYSGVRATFNKLTTAIGLRTEDVRPRIHDLRHSFAVRTLINWHRSGVDVEGRIAVLSNYLGHVNPAGTYWYLSAAPELMELAAARLDSRYGARS